MKKELQTELKNSENEHKDLGLVIANKNVPLPSVISLLTQSQTMKHTPMTLIPLSTSTARITDTARSTTTLLKQQSGRQCLASLGKYPLNLIYTEHEY